MTKNKVLKFLVDGLIMEELDIMIRVSNAMEFVSKAEIDGGNKRDILAKLEIIQSESSLHAMALSSAIRKVVE